VPDQSADLGEGNPQATAIGTPLRRPSKQLLDNGGQDSWPRSEHRSEKAPVLRVDQTFDGAGLSTRRCFVVTISAIGRPSFRPQIVPNGVNYSSARSALRRQSSVRDPRADSARVDVKDSRGFSHAEPTFVGHGSRLGAVRLAGDDMRRDSPGIDAGDTVASDEVALRRRHRRSAIARCLFSRERGLSAQAVPLLSCRMLCKHIRGLTMSPSRSRQPLVRTSWLRLSRSIAETPGCGALPLVVHFRKVTGSRTINGHTES